MPPSSRLPPPSSSRRRLLRAPHRLVPLQPCEISSRGGGIHVQGASPLAINAPLGAPRQGRRLPVYSAAVQNPLARRRRPPVDPATARPREAHLRRWSQRMHAGHNTSITIEDVGREVKIPKIYSGHSNLKTYDRFM